MEPKPRTPNMLIRGLLQAKMIPCAFMMTRPGFGCWRADQVWMTRSCARILKVAGQHQRRPREPTDGTLTLTILALIHTSQ
jgi:hypothetical protein